MRPRLLTVLATGALTLSLLGPTGAQAVPPEIAPGPSLPEQASATAEEQATDALDEAQALFEDRSRAEARELLADGGVDATMVLNQLLRARPDLTGSERAEADALLARPTRPGGDGYANYRVREAKPHCGGAICVHYVRKTRDAPPLADADRDRVPNVVEQTLRLVRDVHGTYVNAGYRRPDSDGKRGGRRKKVDIYLADLGGQGLYGYCTSDQRAKSNGTKNYWAYCAIDDDFSRTQFPSNTPSGNRKVTLAHEYFHAVQFAYDAFEDPWFMEASATWVEDELYDDIDDNRQYLPAGQLGQPRAPLDTFGLDVSNLGRHYGNWIYFRYLTEQWPQQTGSLPTLVLETWRTASGRAGADDMYSTQAINAALTARSASFTDVYAAFALANRNPELTYVEGSAYEEHVAWPHDHSLSTTNSPVERTVRLDHLTSFPVSFLPHSELIEPGWTLELEITLPADTPGLTGRVVVHHADGNTSSPVLEPSQDETLTVSVPFTAGEVEEVELVLVNASRRMWCWRGTRYACRGTSRDDNEPVKYRASLVPG